MDIIIDHKPNLRYALLEAETTTYLLVRCSCGDDGGLLTSLPYWAGGRGAQPRRTRDGSRWPTGPHELRATLRSPQAPGWGMACAHRSSHCRRLHVRRMHTHPAPPCPLTATHRSPSTPCPETRPSPQSSAPEHRRKHGAPEAGTCQWHPDHHGTASTSTYFTRTSHTLHKRFTSASQTLHTLHNNLNFSQYFTHTSRASHLFRHCSAVVEDVRYSHQVGGSAPSTCMSTNNGAA